MSNNTVIQLASNPGDTISTEDIGSGVKLPRSKLVIGDYDVDGADVAADNPLPVKVTNNTSDFVTALSSSVQVVKILSGPTGGDEGFVSSSAPMPVNIISTANVNVQNGINVANTVNVTPLGTETLDEGSSWAQRVKVVIGGINNDEGDVDQTNPLPTFPAPITVTNSNAYQQSSVNQSAIVSYSASSGVMQVIGGVGWSYSGTGTMAGQLTIQDESENIVFQIDITDTGPGFIPFNPPITTGSGHGITVTLAGGGSSIIGKVNVLSYWTINAGD